MPNREFDRIRTMLLRRFYGVKHLPSIAIDNRSRSIDINCRCTFKLNPALPRSGGF
jgi:predicted KAP-like P-loop ATPase